MKPRKSIQRDTIRSLLLNSNRPLDSEELWRLAKARVPTVGRSTVYRVLRRLEEGKVIQTLIGPGQKLYYEVLQGPHHHSFCRKCEVAFCVHATLDVAAMVPAGFVLEDQVLFLLGCCSVCENSS